MPRSATAARAGAARILACAGGRSCARGVAVDQDFATSEEFARLPFDEDLLARGDLRCFAGLGFAVKDRLRCLSRLLRRAGLLTAVDEMARLVGSTQAFAVIKRRDVLDCAGRVLHLPQPAAARAPGAHRPTPVAARLAQALSGGTFLAEAASRLAATAANAR